MSPLVYILAPFGMAFTLFALYLAVSILIGDPVRPFRMFAAGGAADPVAEATRIMDILAKTEVSERHRRILRNRLEKILAMKGGPEDLEIIRARYRLWLAERG